MLRWRPVRPSWVPWLVTCQPVAIPGSTLVDHLSRNPNDLPILPCRKSISHSNHPLKMLVVCFCHFRTAPNKSPPVPLVRSVGRHGLPLRGGDAAAGLPQRPGCEGQAAAEGGHSADHLSFGGQGAASRGKLGRWAAAGLRGQGFCRGRPGNSNQIPSGYQAGSQ